MGRGSVSPVAFQQYASIGTTMRGILSRSCALLALLMVSACGTTKPPELAAQAPGQLIDSYHVGVDDVVQVSVWRNPDLSVNVPVRPDGMISVPLVGDVRAGGRTPIQIAEDVKKRLSTYIREPNVTVIVTGLRSHEYLNRVRVTGAVRQIRSMTYRQGMTVLDAVLEAGGPNDFASPNGTKLYRKSGDQVSVFDVELRNILEKGDLGTNYALLPGDVITVPERLF